MIPSTRSSRSSENVDAPRRYGSGTASNTTASISASNSVFGSTGSPFRAPSPEVRATTGECTGLKIPVSGVQFSPCPPFLFATFRGDFRSVLPDLEPSSGHARFDRVFDQRDDHASGSACRVGFESLLQRDRFMLVQCRKSPGTVSEHRLVGDRVPRVDRLGLVADHGHGGRSGPKSVTGSAVVRSRLGTASGLLAAGRCPP